MNDELATYHFTADIIFQAENTDKAWRELRRHFDRLVRGAADFNQEWYEGTMSMERTKGYGEQI